MASDVVSGEGYRDIPRNVRIEAWCIGDREDRAGHTEDSSRREVLSFGKVGSHRDRLRQPARIRCVSQVALIDVPVRASIDTR